MVSLTAPRPAGCSRPSFVPTPPTVPSFSRSRDDGIATGGTARAAIQSIRAQGPKAIILAVPVVSPDAITTLDSEVERIVCLHAPSDLFSIGLWYKDFEQVSDEEALRLLDRARQEQRQREEVDRPGTPIT